MLRRIRDPFLLAGWLRRRGFSTPITRVDVPHSPELASPRPSGERGLASPKPSGEGGWLLKPFRSGGGRGVRRWRPGMRVPRRYYAQERIDGTPASIVFVAGGGRAVPLGVSRQLVGLAAFGASNYQYCGNVLVTAEDPVLNDGIFAAASDLAGHVAEAFSLVGLNGIDFIVRDGVPYPIEVNPRWCSSMELVERLYGVSMFGLHAAACADGALPAVDPARARRDRAAIGKAIVFAREDVVVGDTQEWLRDPMVRDVPRPGVEILRGQPVCTIFATGVNAADCDDALVRRASELYDHLAAPTDAN